MLFCEKHGLPFEKCMEGLSGFRGEKAIKELMLATFYLYRFKLEDLNKFFNRIKCDL